MLKRVGESRHLCWTQTVVQNQFPMLPLKRTALVGLSKQCLMTWIRLVLMLYFFMFAHKAACKNPAEGLPEVYEDLVVVLLLLEMFFTKDS